MEKVTLEPEEKIIQIESLYIGEGEGSDLVALTNKGRILWKDRDGWSVLQLPPVNWPESEHGRS